MSKIYKEFDISDLATWKQTKIMEIIVLGNWQSKIDDLQLVVKGSTDVKVSGYGSRHMWKSFEEKVINR